MGVRRRRRLHRRLRVTRRLPPRRRRLARVPLAVRPRARFRDLARFRVQRPGVERRRGGIAARALPHGSRQLHPLVDGEVRARDGGRERRERERDDEERDGEEARRRATTTVGAIHDGGRTCEACEERSREWRGRGRDDRRGFDSFVHVQSDERPRPRASVALLTRREGVCSAGRAIHPPPREARSLLRRRRFARRAASRRVGPRRGPSRAAPRRSDDRDREVTRAIGTLLGRSTFVRSSPGAPEVTGPHTTAFAW